ncbi:MAG TPA: hypothetical protein VMS89_04645 [Methanoregulaceae archaeon]|nr:hypothetical protein [Methanoregulaceae archaeon]
MPDDIKRALALLFTPGTVIELRAILDNGTMASGYYDDTDQLALDAEKVEGANAKGIYVTLNELDPALLARSSNRIRMKLSKKDPTTGDENVTRRRWFPVDIDAVRPSGVSSSDAEHTAAREKAARIAQYLRDEGWPEPVLGDSGNGAHLLYAIDLPNDVESTDLVKRGLESLALLFDDRKSEVDTANHNASRIWKLYGTVSRKGDSTRARPHRRSVLVSVPEKVVQVTKEQLAHLASTAMPVAGKPEKKQGTAGPAIDLGRWLRDHSVDIADEKPYHGGVLFTLGECPFSGSHKDGAFAIQFPSGAIYAGCHHSSCGGGEQRWQELREKFDPKTERKKGVATRPPPPGGPGSPPPAPASGDIPHYDEAMAVLQHGDPLKVMLDTFALDHVGDEVPAECLIVSLASRYVDNNNGLHVSVSGESGKGKSDTFNKILLQVPERFRLEGGMSNKALFYMDDLQPGTAIVFDDKLLSDDMQEILKGAISSFRKPINYRTVSQERKSVVCSIPERCIWWIAKVEGSGDDQVFNRMLTCWIDDSPEQDAAVLVEMAKREKEVPKTLNVTRPEVLTCRAMWEIIGRERLHVVIPYATRVEFQSKANRRNPEMFFSLIKAHALLFFMQRERYTLDTGESYIVATLDDFYAASVLFGHLNGSVGGQESKLTRREAEILLVIAKRGEVEFTIQQLQVATNLSYQAIHRSLQGYHCRGQTYSGLLDKCPAISFTDRTIVSADDMGLSVRRRSHAYQFNFDVYRLWSAGGATWLRPDDDHDDDDTDNIAATFSTFSAGAERTANEDKSVENQNAPCTINKKFNNDSTFSKQENTEHPVPSRNSIHNHTCEMKHAERDGGNFTLSPPISKQTSNYAANMYSSNPEAAERAEKEGSLLNISSRDYKLLDHPEYRTTCSVCGRKGSDYIEKLTPERKARDDKTALRICKSCYKTARKREQGESPPLPGTIVLARMVRTTKQLGRCSVCNLGRAVFTDKEAGIYLCQQCYDREARTSSSANGGVSQ